MNQSNNDTTPAKILIVDDIPANLSTLSETLEPEGYNILVAQSGGAALKVAARARPDLILLDVLMPQMDGFETCRQLKADATTAEIPVIFVTAKGETENVIEGFGAGGVDYITKPFQHEEVRARAKTHLTIKQFRDRLTEELETARVIQQGFLPASPPELPNLDIATFQNPATFVGGDYYDFFPDTHAKLIVAIGDATGHGVGASLMVSATKTALLTIDEPNLTSRVNKINALLKQLNHSHRLNMALTLVELCHDANSNTIIAQATGGGMPPLYILRANGEVEAIMITGLPLGAMDSAKYESTEFQLETSDALILASDGLPERLNDKDEMVGDARLTAFLETAGKTEKGAQGVLEALVKFGNDWSNHTPQNDDVTLVVLKVK